MAKEKIQDIYLQWFAFSVSTHPTDSTIVNEHRVPTGMSARGGYGWLVHVVEFRLHPAQLLGTGNELLHLALSTRPGLGFVPILTEVGLISDVEFRTVVDALGTNSRDKWLMPIRHRYLPPMLIAPPTLSLYIDSSAGHVDYESSCRVGYTTVPLEPALYVELAETWGLV